MSGEPPSVRLTKAWPWHIHSLRVAVLYHLTGIHYTDAVDAWPELQIRDLDVPEPAHSVDHDLDLFDVGVPGGGGSDSRGSRSSGSTSPPPQPRSPAASKHSPKQSPADGKEQSPGLKERTLSGGLGLVGRTGGLGVTTRPRNHAITQTRKNALLLIVAFRRPDHSFR
jgi:hypothetical protein